MIGLRCRTWAFGLAVVSIAACSKAAVEEPTPVEPEQPAARFVQRPAKVEGFVEATLPPHWRLGVAAASATPLNEGLGLALQRDGLFLGNERMVAASDGQLERSAIEAHLILPLDEHLRVLVPALEAESRGGFGHANLYLDPDMLVGDLIDVIYTLGRHGFFSYQFAVAANDGDPISFGLQVSPPILSTVVQPQRVELIVIVAAAGLQLGRRVDGQTITWEPLLTWDRQPMAWLESLAAELAAVYPSAESKLVRNAAFMADPELPIARLLEAMNAAAGRECTFVDLWEFEGGDPSRCHFAERIIEANRPAPSSAPQASDSRSKVRATVRSHIGEVKVCYNLGLARDPTLEGRVETRFVIEADGRISQAEIVETTLADPEVESCLVALIDTWRFEGLGNEGKLTIVYPFNFSPGEP